jgi:hypothetical protein
MNSQSSTWKVQRRHPDKIRQSSEDSMKITQRLMVGISLGFAESLYFNQIYRQGKA